ncbi:hypothetical protein EJB05_25942 [Eragrostis curvula]|uniref:Uncharacterized protein n=1 Tax=Eragrostis curvula TaxID=38414 RepID=A0A5J9UJV4_9POAL|nr:hypothetical protein EJB05_25942 [Eragrostis curvula]
MTVNSSAASDDLEKGAGVAVKEVTKELEEVAIVDPWKAMLVNRFMDAFNVVSALVYIGMSAHIGKITNSLRRAGLTFLCLLPVMIVTTFVLHDMRKRSVRLYATKKSVGGSDSDLSAKLLASEK